MHKGSGLDMKLLRRRDIPILHYVDLPLYEDEMDDNGSSVLRVRLRVMPSFFFVLLRHVLRVDGVLIRQRETRIFHKCAPTCCAFASSPKPQTTAKGSGR